jgi:hypothetical protein
MIVRSTGLIAAAAVAIGVSHASAQCVGNCGTDGADGVVTLSPTGNSSYQFVSTFQGATGAGQISGAGGTDGSQFTSAVFGATAGQPLTFYFNYVTSDGTSGFPDYAWAQLLTASATPVTFLFTARTVPSGNTSPGQGLPPDGSTLTPSTTAIIGGAPVWSPLGASSSGTCFGPGCGYTGWIQSTFAIPTTGNYEVVFGVTNFSDTIFDSGLAFDGLAIGGTPIGPGVPEPSTWAMMLIGFAGLGFVFRQSRRKVSIA